MTISDDDKLFNEHKVALEWIKTVEGEKGSIREGDIYPQLKNWINQILPSEILEVGCGQGICSEKIDLDGRVYTGLDLSFLLIDRAKQLYQKENRHFLVGNAYNLPFANNYFDACFSISVWHLIEDLEKAATELSRVLKPHGNFLIITANPLDYTAWKNPYISTKLEGKCLEGEILLPDNTKLKDLLYLHSLEELMNSLERAGLKIQNANIFRESFISIQGYKL